MKSLRKALTLVLVAVMLFALCCPVLAADEKGSITITNATVEEAYAAYKVFDLTYDDSDGVAYTYTKNGDSDKLFAALKDTKSPFTLEETITAGVYNVSAKEGVTGEDIAAWLAENEKLLGTAAGSTTATSSTVKFSNLALGYYYITSSLGSTVTIDSTTRDVEVIDKNQTPVAEFEKNIVVDGELVKTSNANVGDKIDFQVEFDANNYNGDEIITNFFIYDNMCDALTYNADAVVTIDGVTLTSGKYQLETSKKIDDTTYDFVINIPWVSDEGESLYENGVHVAVNYSATVNEKFTAGSSMDNTATYDYISVPTNPDDPEYPEEGVKPADIKDTPKPDKPTSSTETYTTGIKIKKIDGTSKEAISGAKFKITGFSSPVVLTNKEVYVRDDTNGTFWKLRDGTYTEDEARTEDTYVPAPEGYDRTKGGYVKEGTDPVTYRLAKLEELEDDKIALYLIKEANVDLYDNTAEKYKKIVEITKETAVGDDVQVEDWVKADGTLEITGLGTGTYTITEVEAPKGYNALTKSKELIIGFDEEKCEFTAKVDGETISLTDGIVVLEVENNKGTVLPTTGGSGTVLLIVLGSLLFMATAVVLVTKKRMYNEG